MIDINIETYEILRQVGGDSISALYEAQPSDALAVEDAQLVLLRVYHRSLAPERYELNLQWSMRALAPQAGTTLVHPGVLRITTWGSTDEERPYLVLQHAPGLTLAARLNEHKGKKPLFDPPAALTLIHDLTQILDAALQLGVVHRDLQPDQILLREDDGVALMGLDLPYALATLAHEEQPTATRYLSPEQQEGKAIDARSNIYSLGILLYDLLGGPAARKAEPGAWLPLDSLAPDLSDETYRVVQKSTQKEAWIRYHSYAALQEALRQAVRAEGGALLTPPPPVEVKEAEEVEEVEEDVEADALGEEEPAARLPAAFIALREDEDLYPWAPALSLILLVLLVSSLLLVRPAGEGQQTSAQDASPPPPAPTGLFTGIQRTATATAPAAPVLLPTPTGSATASATLSATVPSASPDTATPTAPSATPTITSSPSPSPTPPSTETATLAPQPPSPTPVPPTATPVPPTATQPPPPPPPPPSSTPEPPTPTLPPPTAPPPTPTAPSPVGDRGHFSRRDAQTA